MTFGTVSTTAFLGAGVSLLKGTNSLVIDANGVPHIAYFRDGSMIPGVPPGQRERVFDRFYRLEHHEKERHGTGMGLAISRGLVQAHGGQLWVEQTPGGGFARSAAPELSSFAC